MAGDACQGFSFPAGVVDVESTGVVVSDEQGVVLRGLVEHAVAPVRHVPHQGVPTSHGAFCSAAAGVGVQGGGGLRPCDHVEVAIAVEVAQGGDIGVEANEGQGLVTRAEIPIAEEVALRGHRVVHKPIVHVPEPHPDTALAVVEDVRNAVAVGVPQEHPIAHVLRKGLAPIRAIQIGQGVFRYIGDAALEGQDAVAFPVKDEQVLHTIPIEVRRRELGGCQAADPRVVQGGAFETQHRDGVPSAQFREALPCCKLGDDQSKQEDG